MKYHQLSSKIWLIEGFCTPIECQGLIELSEDQGYVRADVNLPGGAKIVKGIRNNKRAIYMNTDLVQAYWSRLRPYCPPVIGDWVAIGLHERLRFYKYQSGERFKRHIDGHTQRNTNEKSFITFMIYLNDDYQGGHTIFDEVDIKPQTGMALCFMHAQKHEGSVIESGIKYVLRTDVMYQNKNSEIELDTSC